MTKFSNYIVVGSGLAGLTFAIKMAEKFPERKITIVTKSEASESNTRYAQGGIAAVMDELTDNLQSHIDDTLICGDGLSKEDVVKLVVTNGPAAVQELIEWGARFDKSENGMLDLGLEGGHSCNRVVHHKDHTGLEIANTVLRKAKSISNIEILDFHFATDLIIEDNSCIGIKLMDQKKQVLFSIYADAVILASGGIGQLYGHTTNPEVATGDGIAMAFLANAKIGDMEFIQFHPTAFYKENSSDTFLISEALRGFGAYLRTEDGNRFMMSYDSRGELASRDIISRSIMKEVAKLDEKCVYLDCTHLDQKELLKHFPTINSYCLEQEIDIKSQWIPVLPAQHYLCGGIEVSMNGETSVQNLFAAGECSYTGLHGANRLASNSLLEAVVFANQIFYFLSNKVSKERFFVKNEIKSIIQNNNNASYEARILKNILAELQLLMRTKVGIVRDDDNLYFAKAQIKDWQKELSVLENKGSIAYNELQNMLVVASLIVRDSLERTENKGGFYKEELMTF